MCFFHFWQLLKPNAELLIDYGGHGNLERPISVIFKIMRSEQFKEQFANWKQSWYFPKPDETERLLQKVGFKEIQVDLSSQIISFSDRHSFVTFVRTVIMKPFLGYLPDANRKEQFIDAFCNAFEGHGWPWSMEFMRLTISARKILT